MAEQSKINGSLRPLFEKSRSRDLRCTDMSTGELSATIHHVRIPRVSRLIRFRRSLPEEIYFYSFPNGASSRDTFNDSTQENRGHFQVPLRLSRGSRGPSMQGIQFPLARRGNVWNCGRSPSIHFAKIKVLTCVKSEGL
jgi:hypothetical protein